MPKLTDVTGFDVGLGVCVKMKLWERIDLSGEPKCRKKNRENNFKQLAM